MRRVGVAVLQLASSQRSKSSGPPPSASDVRHAATVLGMTANECKSFSTVRSTYIRLIKQHHPDVASSANATEQTTKLNWAYKVLESANRHGVLQQPEHHDSSAKRQASSAGEDPATRAARRPQSSSSASSGNETNDADSEQRRASTAYSYGGDAQPPQRPLRSFFWSQWSRWRTQSADTGDSSTAHDGSTAECGSGPSAGDAGDSSGASTAAQQMKTASRDSQQRRPRSTSQHPYVGSKEDEAPGFVGYYYERTYAKVVAGTTVSATFDVRTHAFTLVYCGDPRVQGNTTMIAILEALHYRCGFDVSVRVSRSPAKPASRSGPLPSGDDDELQKYVTWRFDKSAGIIFIEHDKIAVGIGRLVVAVHVTARRECG